MINILKKAMTGEKGHALLATLVMLMITPVLNLMSTGIKSGRVCAQNIDELYSADAGIEDAIWKIKNQVPEVANLTTPGDEYTYPQPSHAPLLINGKSVVVTIEYLGGNTYRIMSTATGEGNATQIEAYIVVTSFSIMDHLITIQENLDDKDVQDLQNDLRNLGLACPLGCGDETVCGKAYDYNGDAYRSIPQECKGCIAVYNAPIAAWPNVTQLVTRYSEDVQGKLTYNSDTKIDLNGKNCPANAPLVNGEQDSRLTSGLGPARVNGKLTIRNKDKDRAASGCESQLPSFTDTRLSRTFVLLPIGD